MKYVRTKSERGWRSPEVNPVLAYPSAKLRGIEAVLALLPMPTNPDYEVAVEMFSTGAVAYLLATTATAASTSLPGPSLIALIPWAT